MIGSLLPLSAEQLQLFIVLLIVGATTQIARALTSGLDQDIENAAPVKGLGPELRNLVHRLLSATHHWWIGGLIFYYWTVGFTVSLGPLIFTTAGRFELAAVGIGLMIDDYDDMPIRIKDILGNIRSAFVGDPPYLIVPAPPTTETPTTTPPTPMPAPQEKSAPKEGGLV